MDYFHTDDAVTIRFLAHALHNAANNGRRVRIDVQDGQLKLKVGEGMWTSPFKSTPDAYRDGENTLTDIIS